MQFEGARHRANQATETLQMGPEPDILLPDATNVPQDWNDWASGMDGFSLGNYDFLSHPQMASGWDVDNGFCAAANFSSILIHCRMAT